MRAVEYLGGGTDDTTGGALACALKADLEASHRGDVRISLECDPDSPLVMQTLVQENPGAFFRLIERLPLREADVLTSYFILHHTLVEIAATHHAHKSNIAYRFGMALHRLKGNTRRSHKKARKLIRSVDHGCLGQFRIRVEDVERVFRVEQPQHIDVYGATNIK